MLNKNKKRIFSFLLVCILTLSLPLAASAASAGTARSGSTLFTLVSTHVDDLLTTDDGNNTGKQFKPSQFSGATLYVDGLFYHSDLYTTRNTIRTGACYWNGSYYAHSPGLAREGVSNVGIIGSTSMKNLNQNIYYYGFVTNLDSAGYVAEGTGRLSYASS